MFFGIRVESKSMLSARNPSVVWCKSGCIQCQFIVFFIEFEKESMAYFLKGLYS